MPKADPSRNLGGFPRYASYVTVSWFVPRPERVLVWPSLLAPAPSCPRPMHALPLRFIRRHSRRWSSHSASRSRPLGSSTPSRHRRQHPTTRIRLSRHTPPGRLILLRAPGTERHHLTLHSHRAASRRDRPQLTRKSSRRRVRRTESRSQLYAGAPPVGRARSARQGPM